jgi:hypothetical protein
MSAPLQIINRIFPLKISMSQFSINMLFWGSHTLGTFSPILFYFPWFNSANSFEISMLSTRSLSRSRSGYSSCEDASADRRQLISVYAAQLHS